MFYLGIDIAKNTHVASLIDEKGKNIFKGFSFSNTTEGGKSLLEIIQKHVDFSDVTVGMEATGHYWLSVYSFLYDYNFHSIHVINPIQTDGWRKGTEIRKRKNDIIDWDNGTMVIYSENINKYLEKYACKDADDLIDTLWYSYGMFVKII